MQVRGLRCRLPCRVPDASSALPTMCAQRTTQEAGVILEEARPSREPWWWDAGLLWAGHLRRFTESRAWAHCTNEVHVLLYPLRTRFCAPSVEVLHENRGTEAFLFFLHSLSPERDGHRDNNSVPEEQRLHNDTNLPFPFIYQMTARANRQIQAKYAHTLAHKHTPTDRCKIMHFLADSQSKSDDSNQFLDTNRASNPLMVQWKWALQDGSLAPLFGFHPHCS